MSAVKKLWFSRPIDMSAAAWQAFQHGSQRSLPKLGSFILVPVPAGHRWWPLHVSSQHGS